MRPIDADAIPYTMLYKEDWSEGTGQEKQGAWKEDIDKIPTIEPKRGRWVRNFYELANGIRVSLVTCDRCCSGEHGTMWNYCPNCGAKMQNE